MRKFCKWGMPLAAMLVMLSVGQGVAHQPNVAVEEPRWERRPSGSDVARLTPPRASRMQVTGRAVIKCVVTRQGGLLRNCAVTQEEPKGYGFGDAALRLAPLFKMAGLETTGPEPTVSVPIVFRAD